MSLLLALLVMALVLVIPPRARRRAVLQALSLRRARRPTRAHSVGDRAREQSPQARVLAELEAALEVGLPPRDAVTVIGQHRAGVGGRTALLDPVLEAAATGAPIAPAWRVSARTYGPAFLHLAQAWSVSEKLGCPLAQAVSVARAGHEARLATERAVAAQSAGARATMNLLSALPVLGLLALPVIGVDLGDAYPPAVLVLCVIPGLVLLALGRFLTARLMRSALAARGVD
ncbi:hypothetical protein ACMYYO_02470 [Dermacoccaceae bacterium W4C1]